MNRRKMELIDVYNNNGKKTGKVVEIAKKR